jgi:hypothetical protein
MFKINNAVIKEEKEIMEPKFTIRKKANELTEKNNDMSCKFIGDDGKEIYGVILSISSKGEYVIGYC